MDRFYLAIIVSALLLFLGATGIFVTRTADLMPHARTVGVAGSRSISAKPSRPTPAPGPLSQQDQF